MSAGLTVPARIATSSIRAAGSRRIATSQSTVSAPAADRSPAVPSDVRHQRQDADVDIRGQPPVQPHFLAAVELPQHQGREVEAIGPHRLLQLQHAVAGHEQPGHVGLDHVRSPRPPWAAGDARKRTLSSVETAGGGGNPGAWGEERPARRLAVDGGQGPTGRATDAGFVHAPAHGAFACDKEIAMTTLDVTLGPLACRQPRNAGRRRRSASSCSPMAAAAAAPAPQPLRRRGS